MSVRVSLIGFIALALLSSGAVAAQPGLPGRTRVLHEPPPNRGQRGRSDLVIPGKHGDADLPAAIETARGTIKRPGPEAGGPPPPLYDAPQAAADEPDRVHPDRRTGGESDLEYGVVFDPSVMPFKRDRVFDQVAPDGALTRSGIGRVALQVRGSSPRPGHELFWGQLTVALTPGKHTPLPSVAPDSTLLQWQSTPPLPLAFFRDRAGNWSVTSSRSGSAVLRMLVDAPSGYFSAPMGEGAVGDDPWRPSLPARLQRQLAALWPALEVHPTKHDRRHNLRQLAAWYRGFETGELPASAGGDLLAELTVARRGVCRHRAMAFVAMAHSLGIPSQYVMNDAHAFVEVWALGADGLGAWQRVDLGGSAETLRLRSAADKHLHQPLYNDPLPRPEAYADAIGQASVSAGLAGSSWAGARQVVGAERMNGAHKPGSRPPASGDPPTAAPSSQDPAAMAASRAWLRRRAMAVTARQRPPPVTGAPGQGQTDGRLPTSLRLTRPDAMVYVGETLRVRGTLQAAGGGRLKGLPIEVWLVDSSKPTEGAQIGTAISGADGAFDATVHVPLEANLGVYDLVVRFPGNGALGPTFSTDR